MSRKSRGKKQKQAVPEEILAEGSGPVEGAVVHVGIDTIAADEPEPVITDGPATVEELAAAVEELEAAAASADPEAEAAEVEALAADALAASAAEPAELAESAELAEPAESAESAEPGADPVLAAAPDALEELTDEEAAEMGAVLPTSAATMDSVQLRHLVEALVFASDKPMTMVRLRQLTRVSDVRRLEQALTELADDYKERGIVLQQVSGGYQFRTRTQFSAWVQQLIAGRPVRLSRAQLETLAIIAYRQPITRPEIDEIRGVDSSATLKLLLDRSLIRILGKKEEVGRPMLYGTTKEFLDFFSLGDLRELPTLREYSELTDESRQVMSDELGIDPDAEEVPEETDEPVEAEPSVDDMLASYAASMDESAPADDADRDAVDGAHDVAAAADAADAGDMADDVADAADGAASTMRADGVQGDDAMQADIDAPDAEPVDDDEAPASDDDASTKTSAVDEASPMQADASDDAPPMEADAVEDAPHDAAAADDDAPTMQVHVRDEAATTGVFHVAAATASLESLAARRMAADAAADEAAGDLDLAAADAELADADPALAAGGTDDDDMSDDDLADGDAPDDTSVAAGGEDEASEGDAMVAADATVADLHEAAKHEHDSSTTE